MICGLLFVGDAVYLVFSKLSVLLGNVGMVEWMAGLRCL